MTEPIFVVVNQKFPVKRQEEIAREFLDTTSFSGENIETVLNFRKFTGFTADQFSQTRLVFANFLVPILNDDHDVYTKQSGGFDYYGFVEYLDNFAGFVFCLDGDEFNYFAKGMKEEPGISGEVYTFLKNSMLYRHQAYRHFEAMISSSIEKYLMLEGGSLSKVGSAPFGFCIKNGIKIPLQEEIDVAARILDLHNDGFSLRKIVENLEANNIKTKRSKKWYPKTVSDIINSDDLKTYFSSLN